MWKLVMTAGVVVWMAAAAAAGPFEDGLAAADREDYNTALSLWLPLAEQGDADAQFRLGVLYDEGTGVAQSDAEALGWYRKAADQGLAEAQLNVGFMYRNGQGVAENAAEAVEWYRKAADQGLADAQSNLGQMYDQGEGVPQNDVLAYMWFDLAAAQDDKEAADNRDIVAGRLSDDQIAEAKAMVQKWQAERE